MKRHECKLNTSQMMNVRIVLRDYQINFHSFSSITKGAGRVTKHISNAGVFITAWFKGSVLNNLTCIDMDADNTEKSFKTMQLLQVRFAPLLNVSHFQDFIEIKHVLITSRYVILILPVSVYAYMYRQTVYCTCSSNAYMTFGSRMVDDEMRILKPV